MALKINVYIDISDNELKKQASELLSEDWATGWHFISKEQNKALPEETDIAVIDHEAKLEKLGSQAVAVFMGTPEDDAPYFTLITDASAENLAKAIKRANAYREITNQNAESLYSPQNSEALECVAHNLNTRINQLMKQSRMRIELVNQMPVGVIGIDDENTVVLVNPEAIRLLDADEIPVWGLQAGELLSEKINPFLKNKNKKDIRINIDGTEINIRKSFFYLDNSFAGTILVLWENGQ